VGLCVLLVGVGKASANIVVETVPVGNVGNETDTTGYGTVNYAYNIGKFEVTAGQYTAFLNAVAATDTYALYNLQMMSISWGSGIQQSGISGNYTYSVDPTCVNRPVNYVRFWDVCRFANWLNNGQQGPGTTETGAYTMTTDGITNNTITRNTGATWAVTSEDEWYKAAYYNPSANDYYLYPTSSNTAPGRNMADPLPGNNANYGTGDGAYPIDSGKYKSNVGEFQNSASPYGTFDQGGNVWEWNDAIISSRYRGLRGGAFANSGPSLQSGGSSRQMPSREHILIGFRVVNLTVPEPASLVVLCIGVIGMLVRRRRSCKWPLAQSSF
jgi:formylglycine-generating enzyme required for sulfatase activity